MTLYLGYNIEELAEKEKFITKLPSIKRRFVEIYTTTLSVNKTSEIMKISIRRAYKLLKDPDVQTAISYMQSLISFRNAVTQDYFVSKLKEIIENKGTKTSEKIQALGLLARITGHIKEKSEQNTQIVVLKNQNFIPEDSEE